MGISVKFYSLSKKLNSTKQPSGAALAELSCVLKDGTGVVSPAIEVATASNPSSWNYCYISDFSRYYYVDEWTYNRGVWIATLSVDSMASNKTTIGNSTQYVARSATAWDGNVVDTGYATKANIAEYHRQVSNLSLTYNYQSGTYVVGIVNKQSGTSPGGISYYAMTYSELNTLRAVLLSDIDYMGDTGENAQYLKTQVNPFQYITSIRYYPTSATFPGTVVSNIALGWWTPSGIAGKKLSGNPVTIEGQIITLNEHPDLTRGNYLRYSPYTYYALTFSAWGQIDLPNDRLAGRKYVHPTVYIDPMSGTALLKISASADQVNAELVGCYTTQLGVDIPVTSLSFSTTNLLNPYNTEVSSNVNTMFSGLPIIGGFMSGILEAQQFISKNVRIDNINKSTQVGQVHKQSLYSQQNYIGVSRGQNSFTSNVSGSMGSTICNEGYGHMFVTEKFLRLTEEDLTNFGRPLCQKKKINSMSGYIKCADARIDLACTPQEISEVVGIMNGGFYYE